MRTRRLPIAAPVSFNKLPSNCDNWWLQGRFHCWYAMSVASLAMTNPALFLRFLRSLSDTCYRRCELHKLAHTSHIVDLRRITAEYWNTRQWSQSTLAMAVAIHLRSTRLDSHRCYGCCEESAAAATDMLQRYIQSVSYRINYDYQNDYRNHWSFKGHSSR